MKRLHIALGVSNIEESIKDYSQRLECEPIVVVPNEYALWRTANINLSIRRVDDGKNPLRHLGWEDDSASKFTQDTDVNGIVWERFNKQLQEKEIADTWPSKKQ